MLTYVAKSGDTLAGVAQSHFVSVAELTSANPEVSALDLRAGVVLRIPSEPLAQANAVLPQALDLVKTALGFLRNANGGAQGTDQRVQDAIQRHWKLNRNPRGVGANLRFLVTRFGQIQHALENSRIHFLEVDNDRAQKANSGRLPLPAAFTYAGRQTFFTSFFASLGPKARTAVEIHETAHLVDQVIGHGTGFESGPQYAAEPPGSAITNAHCYANFAADVHPTYPFDPDRPWGLARPNE